MLSSFSNRTGASLFSLRFAQIGTGVASVAIKRCANRKGWVSECVHLGEATLDLPFHHLLYFDGISLGDVDRALLSSVTNVIAQNMPLLCLLVLPKKQEKLPQALYELGYEIAECQHDSTYYVVGFLQPEDRYRFGWPEHLMPTDEKLSVLQKMYIKGYLSQQKKYKSFRYLGWEKASATGHFLRDEEVNLFHIFQEILQASAVNLYSAGIQLSLFRNQLIPT